MGARVREEVRGVTAYRPSPNRGLRLGANARARRTRARDSGSSAYARTREKKMVLHTCFVLLLYTIPVQKKAAYEVMHKSIQCRKHHLHGTDIAPSTPDVACLPAVPIPPVAFRLPPSSRQLRPQA